MKENLIVDFYHEKTPQSNFFCQNFSVENDYLFEILPTSYLYYADIMMFECLIYREINNNSFCDQ